MKEFQKVQMIAKNLPTGSYAAGCSVYRRGAVNWCLDCERTQ